MKMTIITDAQGQLLGAVQGHSLSDKQGGVEVSVTFAPGHQAHQLEVDDDLDIITDADAFQQRLQQHLDEHLAVQP